MVLTVDVGNTNIVFGGFEGDTLRFTSRVRTDKYQMRDEYAIKFLELIRFYGYRPDDFDGAVISSVVPPLIPVFPNGDFALVPGAGGLLVGLVQGIFQRLHETYKNIPAPALTWIYDRETAEAAAVIREKAGLSPGEELDAQAWNVLSRLYASVQL